MKEGQVWQTLDMHQYLDVYRVPPNIRRFHSSGIITESDSAVLVRTLCWIVFSVLVTSVVKYAPWSIVLELPSTSPASMGKSLVWWLLAPHRQFQSSLWPLPLPESDQRVANQQEHSWMSPGHLNQVCAIKIYQDASGVMENYSHISTSFLLTSSENSQRVLFASRTGSTVVTGKTAAG